MIHLRILNIDPKEAVPIWRQIEDEMRRLIAVGRFGSGDAVPSVRDLARELRVNPATVAKAYQHLTDAGLLEVKRGEGTFVSQDPPAVNKNKRRQGLEAAALRYVSVAVTLGASVGESIQEVEEAFERLGGDGRRKA